MVCARIFLCTLLCEKRGTSRIQIRFCGEIWREMVIERRRVPHGKVAVIGDQSVISFLPGALFYRLHCLAALWYP